MVKEIMLHGKYGDGKIALIDDEDYPLLCKESWRVTKRGYVKNGRNVPIHRMILNLSDPKIQVDHKDNNKLNNQKHNLRLCDSTGNNRNRPKFSRDGVCASKYKGVIWQKKQKKWKSNITYNNKKIHIGQYFNEIDAAEHYDYYALKYF